MAEKYGRFVYNDGLRPGQAEEGGWSHLLFDENGSLTDHAVFIPDDDREEEDATGTDTEDPSPEETARRIAVAVGVGIALVAGTVVAAPHIKHWWLGTIAPRLRRLRRKKQTQASAEPILELTAAPIEFSQAVEEAVTEPNETMSSAEAEKRLAAMLAAAAFIADQLRALKNASIDDADMVELSRAMALLTTQQVTDSINGMLARDRSLLDDATSNEFMRIFGGGQEVGGHYVPIRNERIREALRITQDETPDEDPGPRAFVPV